MPEEPASVLEPELLASALRLPGLRLLPALLWQEQPCRRSSVPLALLQPEAQERQEVPAIQASLAKPALPEQQPWGARALRQLARQALPASLCPQVLPAVSPPLAALR